jgi:hypothetical protein
VVNGIPEPGGYIGDTPPTTAEIVNLQYLIVHCKFISICLLMALPTSISKAAKNKALGLKQGGCDIQNDIRPEPICYER